ncbi:MAG: hypothetical protein D6800_00040 [Candidatus Zixiibacteriota bacterium]|nr:MAG: hypothetical protein D6800_00040 [candidate division Zixibacteria bacterium]
MSRICEEDREVTIRPIIERSGEDEWSMGSHVLTDEERELLQIDTLSDEVFQVQLDVPFSYDRDEVGTNLYLENIITVTPDEGEDYELDDDDSGTLIYTTRLGEIIQDEAAAETWH